MFMKTAKMITDDLHDIKKIFFFIKEQLLKKKVYSSIELIALVGYFHNRH